MIIDKQKWRELFDEDAIRRIAETIYAEARGEGALGMHAVAAAIGNRIKLSEVGKGYNWGDTPEEIVTFGEDGKKQFSPWNSKDPNNPDKNPPDITSTAYKTAYGFAETLAMGNLSDPTNGAEHFYASSIAAPKWATGDAVIIGNHKFYSLLSDDSRITLVDPSFKLSAEERIELAFGNETAPAAHAAQIASLQGVEFDTMMNAHVETAAYTDGPELPYGFIDHDAPMKAAAPEAAPTQDTLFWNAFSHLRAGESGTPELERQTTYIAADSLFMPMMKRALDAQDLTDWQKAHILTRANELHIEASRATLHQSDIDPIAYRQSREFFELLEHPDSAFAAAQFGSMAQTPATPAFTAPEEPLFLRAYATAKENRPDLVPYIEADSRFISSMNSAYDGMALSSYVQARQQFFDTHFDAAIDRKNTDMKALASSFYGDVDRGVIPAVALKAPTPETIVVQAVTPEIITPAAVVPEHVRPIILPESIAPIYVADAGGNPWHMPETVETLEHVPASEIVGAVPEDEPTFHADAADKTDQTFKVKGSLSQTIYEAAKQYGIDDISKGKAWLLSQEIADMNDIKNPDRVAAGKEISIPRSVFAPA